MCGVWRSGEALATGKSAVYEAVSTLFLTLQPIANRAEAGPQREITGKKNRRPGAPVVSA